MSCYLWIAGAAFDVDEFLLQTKLRADKVRYKGKPVRSGKEGSRVLEHSSCNIQISDAGFDDMRQQIADAEAYLLAHSEQLGVIKDFRGIEYATIRFGVDGVPGKPVQSLYYPLELIRLAGQLGLSFDVSIYNPDFFVSGE